MTQPAPEPQSDLASEFGAVSGADVAAGGDTAGQPHPYPHPRRRRIRILGRVAAATVLVAMVTVVVAQVSGWRFVPVLTGSMTPTYPAGSLVLTAPVAPDQVAIGDVIAFLPPPPYDTGGRAVLHRVIELDTTTGTPVAHTQGDANAFADPWNIDLNHAHLNRVHAGVSHLGWVFAGGPLTAALCLAGILLLLELCHVLAQRTRTGTTCTCPITDLNS